MRLGMVIHFLVILENNFVNGVGNIEMENAGNLSNTNMLGGEE